MGRKKRAESEPKAPRAKKVKEPRPPKEPKPKKIPEPTEAQQRIAAAGGTCECMGQCGGGHDGVRCGVPHGVTIVRDQVDGNTWQPMSEIDPEKLDGGRPVKVILGSVLFSDGQGGVVEKVFCQRCRLRVDRLVNAKRSAASRKRHCREKLAWAELPGVT